MNDAERRYLAEITEDCRGVLGRGITLMDVERDDLGGWVRLTAYYRLEDDEVWEGAALGDRVIDAHARLRERLLVDRVRLGFTALVESR